MKILFIIDSLKAGGKERQLIELIKGLKLSTKYDIKLILFNDKIDYSDFYNLNIQYYVAPKSRLYYLFWFYKLCNKYNPDIIHSWMCLATILSAPISKLIRCKIIDGSIRYARPIVYFSKLWWMSNIAFKLSNRVVTNSEAGLKTHKLRISEKYRVIYNGFDFGRLKTIIPSNDPMKIINIGMVARFENAKDYSTYIKLALSIIDGNSNIRFHCIGDGPNRSGVESKIPINQSKYIIFTGKINDVESYINNLDICILLNNYLNHAEGISNSIMEYMALGKPVIATKAGGNIEIVKEEITGYLIEKNNFNELTLKLQKLIDDKGFRLKMGNAGKLRIKEKFSIDRMIDDYKSIYKEILHEN